MPESRWKGFSSPWEKRSAVQNGQPRDSHSCLPFPFTLKHLHISQLCGREGNQEEEAAAENQRQIFSILRQAGPGHLRPSLWDSGWWFTFPKSLCFWSPGYVSGGLARIPPHTHTHPGIAGGSRPSIQACPEMEVPFLARGGSQGSGGREEVVARRTGWSHGPSCSSLGVPHSAPSLRPGMLFLSK